MTGFRLLASDVTNLGSVVTRTVRPGLVVGLAPGRGTGAFPKVAPNEDSLGVEELEDGALALVVADGRHGTHASEAAVRLFAGAWLDAARTAPSPEARMRAALRRLDERVRRESLVGARGRADHSEAVVLAGVLQNGAILHGCVGDCALYRVSAGTAERLTPPGRPTLGGPIGLGELLFHGWTIEELISVGETAVLGHTLLMATDGLEEQFSGLDPAAIARMFQGDDLESALRALLAASRGDDNLAVIAVRQAR